MDIPYLHGADLQNVVKLSCMHLVCLLIWVGADATIMNEEIQPNCPLESRDTCCEHAHNMPVTLAIPVFSTQNGNNLDGV